MKQPFLYFEAKLIKEYGKKNGGFFKGNNYELLSAVILKNFFKSINKIDYKIGFILQDKYVRYYEKNQDYVNLDTFTTFFEKHKNEDLDSDFVLIPINEGTKNFLPILLQAKRFGHYQKNKPSESLISFLDKMVIRYSKTETILVIFFDGHNGLDIREVHDYLKLINFPFSRVMFINPFTDIENIWKIYVGELFPSFGYNEYDSEELING